MAWPAAGDTRGIVALPEVGDEVVVGFEHGDIERPIVLGVLFNGQDKPGDDLMKTNDSSSVAVVMPRDFVTKVDGKVTTTAQQDITLDSTQGAVKISSDQGQMTLTAQQAVEISSSGATTKLSGTSGTTIEDQAQITINASGTMSIQANGSLSISAPSITVSADGVLQLSGSEVMIG